MKIKSILSALLLMVSSLASAQYLNVKLEDDTYRSFKTTPNMKVSFGEKAGLDPTESAQTVTINGHTVAVKLADDTPASEVMLSIYVEEGNVKIEAFSKLNLGLWCSTDENAEVPAKSVTNGFYTFELSNVSKDMVVTIGYITVRFDLNNSGMNGNFTAKPEDIKKIDYKATIIEPQRPFSDEYVFRGWYKDKECTEAEAWDFSTGVTKSMTLYAKWTKDPTGNQINGHYFVKLGGYYWATENVGDVKTQTGDDMYIGHDVTYGYYYDYNNNHEKAIAAAGTWNNGSSAGYSWTLPSKAQWQALLDYCVWEWKEDYDYNGTKMNGMLVTGREGNYESGHSIFLPAAGGCDYHGNVSGQGNNGVYWSSTPYNYGLYDLFFNSGKKHVNDGVVRSEGHSVRAVLKEE